LIPLIAALAMSFSKFGRRRQCPAPL